MKNTQKTQYNISQLQRLPIDQLIDILENYRNSSEQPEMLLERIMNPLLERCKTIQSLGL